MSYSASAAINNTLIGPVTLLDAQSSPVTAVTYALTVGKYIQLQYSIIRNGETSTGLLVLCHDGVNVSLADGPNASIGNLGIQFSAIISGPNILVQYTSTSTGFNAFLKYYEKKWN
jgi:hypothetical protein